MKGLGGGSGVAHDSTELAEKHTAIAIFILVFVVARHGATTIFVLLVFVAFFVFVVASLRIDMVA